MCTTDGAFEGHSQNKSMMQYIPLTQQQKILSVMVRDRTRIWFLPQDFMRSDLGELFVGYEASARLSELGKDYPDMIESRRNGKYVTRRLKIENLQAFYSFIPDELRAIFDRYNVKPSEQGTLL